MKIEVALPDIARMMREEIARGEAAATRAMRATTQATKEGWRDQIVTEGLGPRLARTIRAKVYPEGDTSFNAVGFAWTKAPVIIAAHIEGGTIRSRDGFWLAIPLPAAGKGRGGRRITPGEWEQRRGMRLRFVYRRRGPSLLVADGRLNTRGLGVASRSKTGRGRATVPIFLLVPQVKLKKRLDLLKLLNDGAATQADLFVRYWRDR